MSDNATPGQRPLFTVINTFTLKEPENAAAFEERFLSHVEWMRARDGFESHQAVRSQEQPGVYVNLGWWGSPENFKEVLGSEVFQEHAKDFHRIVDVEADPSLGVLRLNGRQDSLADGVVLVVETLDATGDAVELEAAYRAYAEAAASVDGFGWTDFARSLIRPDHYTAVTAWSGAEAAAVAGALPQYAAVLALADTQRTTGSPVAGTRYPAAVPVAV